MLARGPYVYPGKVGSHRPIEMQDGAYLSVRQDSMRLVHVVISKSARVASLESPLMMFGTCWRDFQLFFESDDALLPAGRSGVNSLLQDDWLLPTINEPFSEPDMYEKILAKSSGKCVIATTVQKGDSQPVNNVQQADNVQATIHMSQIFFPSDIKETLDTAEDGGGEFRPLQEGNICEHCSATQTPLWRRFQGRITCNACALYEKLHGKPRPMHLLNQVIRRRNRGDNTKKNSKATDRPRYSAKVKKS